MKSPQHATSASQFQELAEQQTFIRGTFATPATCVTGTESTLTQNKAHDLQVPHVNHKTKTGKGRLPDNRVNKADHLHIMQSIQPACISLSRVP